MKAYVGLGIAAMLIALGAPTSSWAQKKEKRETAKAVVVVAGSACSCKGLRVRRLVVEGTERKFTVPVTKDHGTRLRGADKGHLNFGTTRDPRKLGFNVRRIAANELEIKPLANAQSDATFTVTAQGRTAKDLEYAALVTVKVDDDASLAPMVAQVIHESEQLLELQRQEQTRKAHEQERLEELAKERKRGRSEGREQERLASERRRLLWESKQLMKEMKEDATAHRIRLQPIYETSRRGERTLEILLSRWDSSGTRILAQFKARRDDARPFHITAVSAVTTGTEGAESDLDASITIVDRPSKVHAKVIATIESGQEVRGVIALSPPSGQGLGTFRHRIELIDARTQQTLAVKLRGWRTEQFSLAVTPRDEWLAEVAAREAREARAVQLAVGPRFTYGACWLSDGLENNDLETTDCTSVGIRVTKGITQMLAFETEVVGAWTGNASFEGVTVDGKDDLVRNAKLGRISMSGLLRFGDQSIPYFRVGLDVQGVSYDSQFTAGGAPTDGPDESLDVGLAVRVGGGIQRRFGEKVLVGANVTFAQSLGELTYRSLDAGLYVGYGWNL